jgi:hypothetical protein
MRGRVGILSSKMGHMGSNLGRILGLKPLYYIWFYILDAVRFLNEFTHYEGNEGRGSIPAPRGSWSVRLMLWHTINSPGSSWSLKLEDIDSVDGPG